MVCRLLPIPDLLLCRTVYQQSHYRCKMVSTALDQSWHTCVLWPQVLGSYATVAAGSVLPKIDLQHHAAATSAAYHMHASVGAVEAGFMQGGIMPLLQDPDLVSVIRDAHEAANLAWQHPADGDALAHELQRGAVFDADDADRRACVSEPYMASDLLLHSGNDLSQVTQNDAPAVRAASSTCNPFL